MKSVIAFLALFTCGQVYSDPPSRCCRSQQYTIRYNLTAVNDPSNGFEDEIYSRDYTGRRTLKTEDFDEFRHIKDFNQHVRYFIEGEKCTVANFDSTATMPNESCISEDAVFVREYVEGGETLQVWNYFAPDEGNVTETVKASNCLLVRQDIKNSPVFLVSDVVLHVIESADYILYPEFFEIPSSCGNP